MSRQIDSLSGSRTVPMRVLCLGYFRTGTVSADAALTRLGLRSYHLKTAMEGDAKRDLSIWTEALRIKFVTGGTPYNKSNFDTIVGAYEALLEPSFLYEDLVQAYPDAKVVCTYRDVDDWLTSMRKTICVVCQWPWSLVSWADPLHAQPWWRYVHQTMDLVNNNDYSTAGEKVMQSRYLQHYEGVKQLVPPERLLFFKPGDGWEPLCRFLDLPVPDTPYPKTNDSKDFVEFHRKWFNELIWAAAGKVAVVTVPVLGAATAMAVYWRRR